MFNWSRLCTTHNSITTLLVKRTNKNIHSRYSNLVRYSAICVNEKKKGLCATLNQTLVPCEQRFLSCMAFSVYKVMTGRKQTNYARDKPRE